MKIIVPLAGPDFDCEGKLKAEAIVEGRPLLRSALETRAWWLSGAANDGDIVFIMKRSDRTTAFADHTLKTWYPRAKTMLISDFARGAALSSLAGVALVADTTEPVIIDLADILYETTIDPNGWFSRETSGALALTFASSNPAYSYLKFDEDGVFEEAAEKRVISSNASAGTYLFRSPALLLRSIAHSLDNRSALTHNGLFYVCPLFNGVKATGETVRMSNVSNVRDMKIAACRSEAPQSNDQGQL